MAAMDVDRPPALEAQRKAHPELSELQDELAKHIGAKLYHQFTQTLLAYLASPPFKQAAAADELVELFNGLIKPLETKLDKAPAAPETGRVPHLKNTYQGVAVPA